MRTRLLTASLAAGLLLLAGCAGDPAPTPPASSAAECSYPESRSPGAREVEVPPAEPTISGEVTATLQTSAGDIAMTLDADRTPCTVGSFVSLAGQDFYSDTECHRLTTSGIFVLQCGDPTGTGSGGPGYSYADELDGSETYGAGTVAMANAGPDTNGSQFFLVYEDSPLPPLYTVFGRMDAAGLEVVREVAAAGAVGDTGQGGAPATAVRISGVLIG